MMNDNYDGGDDGAHSGKIICPKLSSKHLLFPEFEFWKNLKCSKIQILRK